MSEQTVQIQDDQIILGASLTIREAETAYGLLNEINPANPWQLDTSALVALDTAGIQLLLALDKRLRQAGGALEWREPPPLVTQALKDLGIPLPNAAHAG